MRNITFEGFFQSLLRLPDVIKSIPDVLRNPAANPMQAAILLSIVLVAVIIVLLSVVLVIMRPSAEEEELLSEEAEEAGEGQAEVETEEAMSGLTIASLVVLLLATVWVVGGITSSSAEVCTSCHSDTKHFNARADDPHVNVSCVSCHETGGPVARVTVNLATRAQHIMFARTNPESAAAYGKPVASDGCMRCHRKQIRATVLVKAQNVRMSHKEPIAAGAQCVDCHVLTMGVVDSRTVGMSPCLRCHDGKVAKADCSECHVGDPSEAIRATAERESMAAIQVPNPECDACHFDMTKCDACHGIRMPHTLGFRAYEHARDASIDIWAGKSTCAKCHYPGHNYCMQNGCHLAPFPSHPSPAWRDMHKRTRWSAAQQACTCHQWNPWDHNGIVFCQICHPTKPKNARP